MPFYLHITLDSSEVVPRYAHIFEKESKFNNPNSCVCMLVFNVLYFYPIQEMC